MLCVFESDMLSVNLIHSYKTNSQNISTAALDNIIEKYVSASKDPHNRI